MITKLTWFLELMVVDGKKEDENRYKYMGTRGYRECVRLLPNDRITNQKGKMYIWGMPSRNIDK